MIFSELQWSFPFVVKLLQETDLEAIRHLSVEGSFWFGVIVSGNTVYSRTNFLFNLRTLP